MTWLNSNIIVRIYEIFFKIDITLLQCFSHVHANDWWYAVMVVRYSTVCRSKTPNAETKLYLLIWNIYLVFVTLIS